MELKDFIRVALVEIVQGATSANDEIAKLGGSSLPSLFYQAAKDIGMTSEKEFPITTVTFDVAVSTESTDGAKAGIGILAGWFGAGVQGETKQASGAATRLQFSLPLRLPSPEAQSEVERRRNKVDD